MRGQGLPLNTIVLAAIAIVVLVVLAVTFIPGASNIFGSIGGISGTTGDAAFLSECTSRCTNINYKYPSRSAADAAATSNFCNYKDANGNGCQYYQECLFYLSGDAGSRKVQRNQDNDCIITDAGCTIDCFQADGSDCAVQECNDVICQSPTQCTAQCVYTPNDGLGCSGDCCNGVCCTGTEDCCSGVCVPEGTPPNCDGSCGGDCSGDCCTGSESCCSGTCALPGTDQNCDGSCTSCGFGQSCCSGSCTDTTTINNCGGCGVSCIVWCGGHNPNPGSQYCNFDGSNYCCRCVSGVTDIPCGACP